MRVIKEKVVDNGLVAFLLSISVLLTMITPGCSVTPTQVPIGPNPGNIPAPVSKSQVAIGLYFPPELRDYVYHGSVFSYPLVINLGEKSTDLFRERMKGVFQQVLIFSGESPVSTDARKDLSCVIEPSIYSFNFYVSPLVFGEYRAEIIYRAKVYDSQGKELFLTTGIGKGLYEGQTTFTPQPVQWLAEATNRAMEEAVKDLIASLTEPEKLEILTTLPRSPGFAAQGLPLYEEGKKLYYKADFNGAVEQLQKGIELFRQDPPSQYRDQVLADAYILIGSSYLATGMTGRAKEAFRDALQLNPGASLDPSSYAPKIIRLFEEVRSEVQAKRGSPLPKAQTTPAKSSRIP